MKRVFVALSIAAAALVFVPHSPQAAATQACGLPDAKPLWVDYTDGTVPFGVPLFGKPGVTVATQGTGLPPQFRQLGAGTIYWEMHLGSIVGTTTAPADPAAIDARAQAMFDAGVARSGCSTPFIALNELNGAGTTTPWSPTNAQYRANVLELLRSLSSKGARPFLLISSAPYADGEAGDWWRQAGQYADLVPEVYFQAPSLYKQGPILASRRLRLGYRRAVLSFTQIGIPVSHLGIMLGFQSGPGTGGREGLQPASAWFEVAKLQTLAARQVAADLKIATVWSWGWGTFSAAGADQDKQAAACVYLWTRDQSLCDGVAAGGAGFDASLTEGQITLPVGLHCTVGDRPIRTIDIGNVSRVTGDAEVAFTALYERLVESEQAQPSDDEVLAAEQSVIDVRFHGSRAAFVAALAAKHATVATARAVLGDELRRARIALSLSVPAPTDSQIQAYYASYPDTLARLVSATPAQSWLGGAVRGFALAAVAPQRVFSLPRDSQTTLLGAGGSYLVRPLQEIVPLSALPLALARPAIRAALSAFARADALESWTESRQRADLNRAVCRGDHLPQVGSVDLSAYLPFLALDA